MHSLKDSLNRKSHRLAAGSLVCLLALSFSVLPQGETQNKVRAERTSPKGTSNDPNSAEAQRRVFAISLLISLATEARSYKDVALRPKVLARAADALWEADNVTARALFLRAWDAAEAGDAEDVTANTKHNAPAFVIGLRKMSGRDLRVDVLSLASRRDRALGEQFLAKLKSENQREANDEKNEGRVRNVFAGSEGSLKRLLVANRLLADGQVAAAREFAAPALTEVNARSISFLSQLRTKDAALADRMFSELLTRAQVDPMADANTISGLSSYAFTPGFYIVFWADGHSTWTQPEGSIVPPDIDAALRARFFQVGADVLLRPVPPPDQDTSSCGRRGKLKVVTRLLPLFEQYAPESAAALRTQLVASYARNIDAQDPLLTEGIRSETSVGEADDIQEQLGRTRLAADRDQIYAAAAARLAPTGNHRARDFADSIDDSKFRTEVRNYVDFELIKIAIRKKQAAEVAQLAGAGELTRIQKSWAYTQAARLLLDSDHDRALDFLQKAVDEAERIDADDPDAALALIGIANQFLAADRTRAWELLNKTVKFANSAEDFTGDDILMPKRSMLVTKSGTRFVNLPDDDFNFSRVMRALANDDLFRSMELAKSFKYDGPRANATIAIAKAILEKPAPLTIATN